MTTEMQNVLPVEDAEAVVDATGAVAAVVDMPAIIAEAVALDADGFDHNYVASVIADASQRLVELTAGLFGDPAGYSTKAALKKDFAELREITLHLRRLLNRFRNEGLIEQKDDMLDRVLPGNKPSLESMEAQMQEMARRIAMRKKLEGKELNEAEEALLAE